MITADQIVCHLVGDYILQSDRMARLKRTSTLTCLTHALCYMLPFTFALGVSTPQWLVMMATHFAIDRGGLARYVVWAKNYYIGLSDCPPWKECQKTGYPPQTPDWLATWLLIIADNILHIVINGLCIKYL